jgi:UTP--glucose-1-phosphate uridylyltransferase
VKGEFYHIDAINALASQGKVHACRFEGTRVDVGDKAGYLEGIIQYALRREDLREDALRILKKYSP